MKAIVWFTPVDLAVVNEGTGAFVVVVPYSMDDALLPWIGFDDEATCDPTSESLTMKPWATSNSVRDKDDIRDLAESFGRRNILGASSGRVFVFEV